MTTRPRITSETNWVAGLAAVALFAVLAGVFATAEFGAAAGFPDASITAGIGYAMFDLLDLTVHSSEEFLVSFVLIAVVLDAALDAAVMLATREEGSGAEAMPDGGVVGGED